MNLISSCLSASNATTHNTSQSTLSEEQELKIADILSRIPRNVSISTQTAIQALYINGWDLPSALQWLDSWSIAESGIVQAIDRDVPLQGLENCGNSCWIDSLLFAIFSRISGFDGVLTKSSTKAYDERVEALRTTLILIINRLRSGLLITKLEMNLLESQIKQLWSESLNMNAALGAQEDVSELLLFLLDIFDAPLLPLWQNILHGAKEEEGDHKLTKERMLQLSVPDPKNPAPISLESLLVRYFFDNKIPHLKRQVPLGSTDKSSKINSSNDSSASVDAYVDGWQMLKLLPFLSNDDPSGMSKLLETDSMLIPILIKRYYRKESSGNLKKTQREVIIPLEISFDEFVKTDTSALADQIPSLPKKPTRPNKFTLRLRSVICHLGSSPNEGHYITYTRQSSSAPSSRYNSNPHHVDSWLRFDGLAKPKVTTLDSIQSITTHFVNEVNSSAYVLIYELLKTRVEDSLEDKPVYDRYPTTNNVENTHSTVSERPRHLSYSFSTTPTTSPRGNPNQSHRTPTSVRSSPTSAAVPPSNHDFHSQQHRERQDLHSFQRSFHPIYSPPSHHHSRAVSEPYPRDHLGLQYDIEQDYLHDHHYQRDHQQNEQDFRLALEMQARERYRNMNLDHNCTIM
ncbi:hypothetical protein BKA69DRAFT_1128224 [Paraphysoderma sedebokerense]|nr:hypothetical protein BKA69DRAFT_1128224 [Paraphysoderma sedebokerense]